MPHYLVFEDPPNPPPPPPDTPPSFPFLYISVTPQGCDLQLHFDFLCDDVFCFLNLHFPLHTPQKCNGLGLELYFILCFLPNTGIAKMYTQALSPLWPSSFYAVFFPVLLFPNLKLALLYLVLPWRIKFKIGFFIMMKEPEYWCGISPVRHTFRHRCISKSPGHNADTTNFLADLPGP